MRYSLITVALNAGESLLQTVQNAMRQTYTDWELIVKDGMSKDDSVEQLPTDQRIRVIRQPDKSIYDAMNQAIAEAKGEYVIFLNCGDFFYSENVLQQVSEVINREPDGGIYYGNAFFRKAGEILTMPTSITPFTCYRHIPCHQACVFDRKLFENDKLNTNYRIRADYDFFLRKYFQEKVRPVYTGITIADYEGGGYSETKENRKKDQAEHREIVNKYMKASQVFWYRFIMIITLQPLRKYLAQQSCFAGCYDRIKRMFYR